MPIWGETKFKPRGYPQSGSKAMCVEEEERKEKERKSVYIRLNQNSNMLCLENADCTVHIHFLYSQYNTAHPVLCLGKVVQERAASYLLPRTQDISPR